MKRKKQTIDSNESIEKDKQVNVFSKMKTPADSNIVTKEYFSCIYHVFDTWHSFFQLCVVGCDLFIVGCDHFVVGCGCLWPFLAGHGWVLPFFGWVWVGLTFFWMGVGGWPFLAGCGWVWHLFSWVWVAK